MPNQIIFAHLLNDFSGSPRVLLSVIEALSKENVAVRLFLGSDGNGCLSNPGVPVTRYWYKRTGYKIFTFFTYFLSQIFLFFRLLFSKNIDKNAVVYCNTLLPFGAAAFGALTGRRVIYHIHEISITPAPLRWFLVSVVKMTSSLNIYVSETHAKTLPVTGIPSFVLHNVLSQDFSARARSGPGYANVRSGSFRVLMIASLREYKGIPELFDLASSLIYRNDICFDLLVNDEAEDIGRYLKGNICPSNLKIYSRVSDTIPFYSGASLVLNLSRVDMWVETFGMTILEAMAFGIPVIAPPVGGPTELIDNGVQGCLIDSRDSLALKKAVLEFADDVDRCIAFSERAYSKSEEFSYSFFRAALLDIFGLKREPVLED